MIYIDNDNKPLGTLPGVIYVLKHSDTHIPFYVGETGDLDQRIKTHRSCVKPDSSQLVYKSIYKWYGKDDTKWYIEEVLPYGKEGPIDLENEVIMELLVNNITLTNMKKGSMIWLQQALLDADEMRVRGLTSYRKLIELRSVEAMQAEADLEHLRWLEDIEQKSIQIVKNQVSLEFYQSKQVEFSELINGPGLKYASTIELKAILREIRILCIQIKHDFGKLDLQDIVNYLVNCEKLIQEYLEDRYIYACKKQLLEEHIKEEQDKEVRIDQYQNSVISIISDIEKLGSLIEKLTTEQDILTTDRDNSIKLIERDCLTDTKKLIEYKAELSSKITPYMQCLETIDFWSLNKNAKLAPSIMEMIDTLYKKKDITQTNQFNKNIKTQIKTVDMGIVELDNKRKKLISQYDSKIFSVNCQITTSNRQLQKQKDNLTTIEQQLEMETRE